MHKRKIVEEVLQRHSEYETVGDKRARLQVVTDISRDIDDTSIFAETGENLSAVDSLFDSPTAPPPLNRAERLSSFPPEGVRPASRTSPPIPGLFAPSVRLPPELADGLMQTCMNQFFRNESVNQVMLFGGAHSPSASGNPQTGIPSFLTELLSTISELLLPELPSRTHALLFPPPDAPSRARQAILNLYHPGEGISPHVDLLTRFADGILGISLGSGCVLSFRKQPGEECKETSSVQAADGREISDEEHLYLPERSVVVLSEEARYGWTHGIQGRTKDFVKSEKEGKGEWIARGVRLSITFRWLLPGADIVGEPDR